MRKNFRYYLGFVGLLLIAAWVIIARGQGFAGETQLRVAVNNAPLQGFLRELWHNFNHPLTLLILQIITILIFSRLIGFAFRKIGQPMVIGEIFAGIVLGPSVLGTLLPEVSAFLFPPSTLMNLQFLSQIGLMLFMFIIGMELDITVLRRRLSEAVLLSHSSIALSFFLGVGFSYFIYAGFAPQGVTFTAFALFVGIAMSIMAFPVLARILQERNLTRTPLGYLALTTAAVDDITAWCMLAVVIAIVKAGTVLNASFTIGMVILYIVFMLKFLQPLLQRLGRLYISAESVNKTFVAFIFMVLMFSSFLTEVIGIHALFGAFLAGVIIPSEKNFKSMIAEKVEDVSLVLLLPLFFVFTGLRTQIGLINHPEQWLICIMIVGLSVTGKFGGSFIASRYLKLPWKNSFSLGVLMNTRGLMELVVVNIGYDLGVIGPEIFAMLVIMALVTTFMTGPAMEIIERIFRKEAEAVKAVVPENRILVSFGRPETGVSLLKLAYYFSGRGSQPSIKVLHIMPRSDISFQDSVVQEKNNFEPAEATAARLGIRVETIYKSTGKIRKEILSETERQNCNFLLLGKATSVFSENILGGKIRYLLERCRCNTGIFIDNNFSEIKNALFIVEDESDIFLLKYASDLLAHENVFITIHDSGRRPEVPGFHSSLPSDLRDRVVLTGNGTLPEKTEETLYKPAIPKLASYSIAIVSLGCWQKMSAVFHTEEGVPILPVLIIKSV